MSVVISRGLRRVHAGRRLVEQQQPGLAGERPGDLEAALIAVGQVARQTRRRDRAARRRPATRAPARAASASSRLWRREAEGGVDQRGVQPRCACPTSTFSMAVMFANRRMFWNVRPMPRRTMSLGRALRKTPRRVSRWTYQGGRMIAIEQATRSAAPSRRSTKSPSPIGAAGDGQEQRTPARPRRRHGANQKNGSAQARRGRATIRAPVEVDRALASARGARR